MADTNRAFVAAIRSDLVHDIPPPVVHVAAYASAGCKQLYKTVQRTEMHSTPGNYYATPDEIVCTDPEGRFIANPEIPLMACRFRFVDIIGTGESAVLIKAEDMFCPSTFVAIKVLNLHFSQLGAQEADCMRRLNQADPHCISGIVRLCNIFDFDCHYCMVYELLDPQPLHKYNLHTFSSQKRLECIREIAVCLLKSLGFLRQMNVIHGDLKPENILLKKKGDFSSVKVVDFGNAIRCVHEELSLYYDNFDFQTLLYRAPEVIFGTSFGIEVDVWSYGCILAELYIGKPLFYGKEKKHIMSTMIDILGPLPSEVFRRGKFYSELHSFTSNCSQSDATLNLMKKLNICDFSFANFLAACLKYDPASRATVWDAARMPFISNHFGFSFLMPPSKNVDDSSKYVGVVTSEAYPHRVMISNPSAVHMTSLELLQHGTGDSIDTETKHFTDKKMSMWNKETGFRKVAQVIPVQRSSPDVDSIQIFSPADSQNSRNSSDFTAFHQVKTSVQNIDTQRFICSTQQCEIPEHSPNLQKSYCQRNKITDNRSSLFTPYLVDCEERSSVFVNKNSNISLVKPLAVYQSSMNKINNRSSPRFGNKSCTTVNNFGMLTDDVTDENFSETLRTSLPSNWSKMLSVEQNCRQIHAIKEPDKESEYETYINNLYHKTKILVQGSKITETLRSTKASSNTLSNMDEKDIFEKQSNSRLNTDLLSLQSNPEETEYYSDTKSKDHSVLTYDKLKLQSSPIICISSESSCSNSPCDVNKIATIDEDNFVMVNETDDYNDVDLLKQDSQGSNNSAQQSDKVEILLDEDMSVVLNETFTISPSNNSEGRDKIQHLSNSKTDSLEPNVSAFKRKLFPAFTKHEPKQKVKISLTENKAMLIDDKTSDVYSPKELKFSGQVKRYYWTQNVQVSALETASLQGRMNSSKKYVNDEFVQNASNLDKQTAVKTLQSPRVNTVKLQTSKLKISTPLTPSTNCEMNKTKHFGKAQRIAIGTEAGCATPKNVGLFMSPLNSNSIKKLNQVTKTINQGTPMSSRKSLSSKYSRCSKTTSQNFFKSCDNVELMDSGNESGPEQWMKKIAQ